MKDEDWTRLADSMGKIAEALAGLNDTAKRAYERQFPEQRSPVEAVFSRVPSDEDKILEAQGATDRRPIRDWLGGIPVDDPEEYIGEREREFLANQKAKASDTNAKAGQDKGSGPAGIEADRSEAGPVGIGAASERDDKKGRKGTRRAKSSS